MKPADLGSRVSPAKVSTVTSSAQMRKMVALYDYDPQELSPNVDAEVRSLKGWPHTKFVKTKEIIPIFHNV